MSFNQSKTAQVWKSKVHPNIPQKKSHESWQAYTAKLNPNDRMKVIEERQRENLAARKKPSTPPAARQTQNKNQPSNPTGATQPGVTQQPAMQPNMPPPSQADLPGLFKRFRTALSQFSQSFNSQIRTYNPAISAINQSLSQIISNPNITYQPGVMSDLNNLVMMLEKANNEQTGIVQILSQLSQLAQKLSTLVENKISTPAQSTQPAQKTNKDKWTDRGSWLGNAIKSPFRAVSDFAQGFSAS